ncbi:SGNH/GDSL hydrolase family protein [Streptococcus macedonicus]|uniref:SGNH/GDSL hydrolase family protein n=1 Tax=Streptococcus macedonicus TaxID=59310 RepID=A0AA47FDL1_STRMC|nr:SGNH/GDSL hydrolase family protein [Streptococcus macedonicus]MBT1047709.1 SGNH/GDSL hydrolase family protein [Streptococcus macedonicus]MCW8486662.1 SGNH/GDSL hydrolase family protein [Streptococcus macedonicus]MCW8494849.1 SGNH/GDSL hydrolase family protein [Streptococcus macedonicus]MCW8500153.1 SGNH/GDSL hydrolase family protein [Streptococcus macedonicus]MCW8502337.1 SGNH/GDSL hydrolase family protein [Streptococcus macedonicus]
MSKKKNILTGFAFFLASLLLFIVIFSVLIPKSDTELTKKDFLAQEATPFNYVAIGDSLTEGVGDTTNQGGFVPLLAQSLTDTYDYQVTASNYGVSGNTSKQILQRMQEKTDIQKSLAKADMMTLTVGGNDVMAVIRKNLTSLSGSSFTKPAKSYQKRLRQIIELARAENEDLPIYVLGIYNPFYLNFPDMTEMQEIVDNWNDATENVTEEYDNVYFVPINDELYKRINGEEGIVSTSGDQTTVINDALFSGDHFHPNNIGYQIMSDVTMEKISETKEEWKED